MQKNSMIENKDTKRAATHYPHFTRGLFLALLLSACLWAMIIIIFLHYA